MPTPTSTTVRRALAPDLPAIIVLEKGSVGTAHWNQEGYLSAIAPGSGRMTLVAQTAMLSVAAFLIARRVADEWDLENLVVDDESRRQGIASAILTAFIDEAKHSESNKIFLEVRASNAAAIALYRKFGFRQDGLRKAYYSNPTEHALLFSLSLKNSS